MNTTRSDGIYIRMSRNKQHKEPAGNSGKGQTTINASQLRCRECMCSSGLGISEADTDGNGHWEGICGLDKPII